VRRTAYLLSQARSPQVNGLGSERERERERKKKKNTSQGNIRAER